MDIIVRIANEIDFSFIKDLAVRSVKYGIPKSRDISLSCVENNLKLVLNDLELKIDNQDMGFIVAEDIQIEKIVGYLILSFNSIEESTGEKQAFIHDVAIEPAYWGNFIMDLLVSKAEEMAKNRGMKYIVGNISIDNKRSLIYSIKRLKFQIERYQLVKLLK